MGFEVFLARINNRRKACVTTANMHENEDSCRIRGRCVCVKDFQGVLHSRVREYGAGSYGQGRV